MKAKAQSEHDDGMLEFLEDIIGTNRFKEPIELLSKKVEELNEARGEKVSYIFILRNLHVDDMMGVGVTRLSLKMLIC